MEIALAVVAVAAIGALIYEKRTNAVREKEWALERGALLRRLQDPVTVAAEEAAPPKLPLVQPPGFDDDEAFHEEKKRIEGLTDGSA